MCFDFFDNEILIFWIGIEEGFVYQVNCYDCVFVKVGFNFDEVYCGYVVFVIGIYFYFGIGFIDFFDFFFISFVDWIVKLW